MSPLRPASTRGCNRFSESGPWCWNDIDRVIKRNRAHTPVAATCGPRYAFRGIASHRPARSSVRKYPRGGSRSERGAREPPCDVRAGRAAGTLARPDRPDTAWRVTRADRAAPDRPPHPRRSVRGLPGSCHGIPHPGPHPGPPLPGGILDPAARLAGRSGGCPGHGAAARSARTGACRSSPCRRLGQGIEASAVTPLRRGRARGAAGPRRGRKGPGGSWRCRASGAGRPPGRSGRTGACRGAGPRHWPCSRSPRPW